MFRRLLTIITLLTALEMYGQTDSIPNVDSIHVAPEPKLSFWEKAYEVIKEFSRVDSDYIESQRFNYTFMLQNTNTYESYRIKDALGNSIRLTPKPSIKFGPYIGWRWVY
ncbi:MAG: DUF4421 family protein, partial [Prevotella sp.]|nr:DUF4421 family protein [Prevotella sp.]